MSEYDVGEAFKRIEEELIAGLMRNLLSVGHENYNNWRLEELQRLEEYRLDNLDKFPVKFSEINDEIEKVLLQKYSAGFSAEEKKIIRELQKGYKLDKKYSIGSIGSLNSKKLNALIMATKRDLVKAEYALLRKASDSYRSIIFSAEVGLNTGSLTYKQAIDMATKDFLSSGIQCITYKNGSVHQISDYADMAVKTANKRAYLYGEGDKRSEYGLHLVLVGQRGGNPCECCIPYIGKVLIDDVYSGGSKEDGDYTLLSEAMDNGLYHPRCKDIHTTYFPGITEKPKKLTSEEKQNIADETAEKQREAYIERQKDRYERLAKYSLSEENKREYEALYRKWCDLSK